MATARRGGAKCHQLWTQKVICPFGKQKTLLPSATAAPPSPWCPLRGMQVACRQAIAKAADASSVPEGFLVLGREGASQRNDFNQPRLGIFPYTEKHSNHLLEMSGFSLMSNNLQMFQSLGLLLFF